MVKRQHSRFPAKLPVLFSGNREGMGMLHNISLGGCQIESETCVFTGDYLNLTVQIYETDPPLKVEVAAVRWSEGGKFGLSFEWLQQEEQQRLNAFIKTIATA
jgi:hypothetical protein